MNLKFGDKLALKIQHLVGWMTFPVWGGILIVLMRFVGRYRVPELKEIRQKYKEVKRATRGPVIVCANHLTKIDSAILNWSLGSVWSYMKSFKFFSWNLPERANFYDSSLLKMVCYLASCIPIDRGGNREAVKKSLDKVIYLLKKGHTVTVFPEGGRSRTGRIDTEGFAYGVGKLVNKVKDCTVLCVYLRGHNQDTYSEIPRRGARFYMKLQSITPTTTHSGLRATRDLASQIVGQLTQMEQVYFASGRQ